MPKTVEQTSDYSKLSKVARYASNAVILMDNNGNIEWINSAFTKLYSYTFEQLMNERGRSIFGRNTDPAVKVAFGKCIVYKKTIRFLSHNTKRSGVKIWVKRTITPIVKNDKVIQLIIIDSNINALKKAEEKIRLQTKKIKLQSNKIKQRNIKLKDINTNLEETNEEFIHQSEKLIAQAEYLHLANEKLRKKQNKLNASYNKLKDTKDQLIQTERMAILGQLTAGIAHEINNPINYINAGINAITPLLNNFTDLIKLYNEITPENIGTKLGEINSYKEDINYAELTTGINELINSIKTGANLTSEIIEGLRTFSRLDEDALKPADINQNIDSTLTMLRNQYKHRIEIIKEYGELPKVECFPGKLNQVFMNIIANAIQAIDGQGTISIKTYQSNSLFNNSVAIEIKDTGSGMAKEVKQRVFEPFFTTKTSSKGTGLGMSICRDIIKLHNGQIELESKPNKGTTFTIYIPVTNQKTKDQ